MPCGAGYRKENEMDILLTIISWMWLILVALYVILYPFLIGKTKSNTKYDADGYIIGLFEVATIVLLIGRVLDWY